jgi:hypothetical protein
MGIAIGGMSSLWAGRLENCDTACWERAAAKAFLFASALDRLWYPSNTCSVDTRAIFLGIKRPGREAYH